MRSCCITQGAQSGTLWQPRGVGWGEGRETQEGGDVCIIMADLHCCIYGFSCGHVWMWELDCEEGWAPKTWCFWTVVLEKTVESPLDCKEIQPVHSEGDQPWDFFGRNDAEAKTPVPWPPHAKSWLIGKDSDAGRDWWQEEKGTPEDEMAGWRH